MTQPLSAHRFFEFSGVGKVYPGESGPAVIVKDFYLQIAEGELMCLIGHSGCGKSTVLSMAAGLSPVSSGAVILAGREVEGPGPDRGVVFQAPSLFHWMTALQNVVLGVEQVHPDKTRDEREAIATRYLTLVGLEDALHKRPSELSSGMRQRVGLARAFALCPRVLLLDEPFGMLDSLTRLELQEVLLELWRKDRKTALMITHDVDEALFLSDRIAMMTQGPGAKVGGVLEVPFERPRNRLALLEGRRYYELREHIMEFLEAEDRRTGRNQPGSERSASSAPPR